MTRRELAALVLAVPGVAAVPAVARKAEDAEATPTADSLTAAREDLRKAAEQLARANLSMTAEPAFRFKA